jgi:gamma-glutamylcyclotransferase (GGCT)/AIG2-like uncharacterized protein YtfP
MRYFAYGSNMGSGQMFERGVRFSARESAILGDWRLEFNKQAARNPLEGFANIVPDPGNRVEGVLYEMEAEDLHKLDHYEGYPHQYTRCEIAVTCNGEEESAVVYVAQPDRVKAVLKPSAEYLSRIRQGADLLSEGYRNRLLNLEALD